MNIQEPLQLLGGISPETFMRRYWQKKPLLIRAAIPGFAPLLDRAELLDLAAQDDVESRLVVQAQPGKGVPGSFAMAPLTASSCHPSSNRPGRFWCRALTCTMNAHMR